MTLPRFKLWMLCLAVATSAVAFKLAMMAGPVLTFTTSLIFLGPLSGIALDRHRGGTGVAGGVIAGVFAGLGLSAFMNIHALRFGRPISWFEVVVSTALLVSLEAFCGWHWGRPTHPWPLPKDDPLKRDGP